MLCRHIVVNLQTPPAVHKRGTGALRRKRDSDSLEAGLARIFKKAAAAAELPDHIGAELEFLGLLLLKAADARGRGAADEAAVAEDAARKFFADHLGSWAPTFCRRLREAAGHPFYAAVADLLQAFLEGEAARLGCEVGGSAGLAPQPAEACLACPMAPPAPPEAS